MEMDAVYSVIGELGRGQLMISAALYLCYVYSGWHFLQLVFTGHEPKFSCQGPDATPGAELPPSLNGSTPLPVDPTAGPLPGTDATAGELSDEEWNNLVCAARVPGLHNCTNLTFHSEHTSIVTEWRLVCEESFKVSMCESMFMLGVFLGSYSMGCLSDHIGRKHSLFACILLGAIFSTISSFATNYIFYGLARLLCGIFFAGCQLITFVHLTEIVGTSKRAICGTLFESALAVSTIIMAAVAYGMKDWRDLTLASSAAGFLLLALYPVLPESPRWFLTQSRPEDAERVLRKIARLNRRSYPNVKLRHCSGGGSGGRGAAGVSPGLCTLFTYGRLRRRTVMMMYVWLCVLGTYYGLSMVASDLNSSIYLNETLLCLVELPGLLLAMVSMSRVGRRATSAAGLLLAGLSCLVVFLVPHMEAHVGRQQMLAAKTGLALFGKMSVTVSMATSFVHTSELMPTTIRNQGLGICTMMGRLGSMAAPFVAKLGFYYPLLEYVIFGALGLSAGVLCLFLPETLNRPMPDTIEDVLPGAAGARGGSRNNNESSGSDDENKEKANSRQLLIPASYYGSINA